MNRRISLMEVTERLQAQLSPSLAVARVGCALETDFLSAVADPANWPGVWVGCQRSTPIDPGDGYTQRVRQDVRVEIVARVIVAKHADGETNRELPLNDLADAVADALIGWRPTYAVVPLVWVSSTDGPAEQSVMTVDLVFSTRITYQSS